MTLALIGLLVIPTRLIGGTDAVLMMAIGAGIGLGTVVAGFWVAQVALRGPDRFGTKLVVGGFVIRMVLLLGAVSALLATTDLDPTRFALWLVAFYFVLVMVEAALLAKEQMGRPEEGTAR